MEHPQFADQPHPPYQQCDKCKTLKFDRKTAHPSNMAPHFMETIKRFVPVPPAAGHACNCMAVFFQKQISGGANQCFQNQGGEGCGHSLKLKYTNQVSPEKSTRRSQSLISNENYFGNPLEALSDEELGTDCECLDQNAEKNCCLTIKPFTCI